MTEPQHGSPGEIYAERIERRRAVVRVLTAREARISWMRLAVFTAGAILCWPVFGSGTLNWAWLLLPLAGFVVLLVVHDRSIRARGRAERAVEFYDAGLARLQDRWAGGGSTGEGFLDPEHPYASDLDLFGRGSLFELISAARTIPGERTLAGWLCEPAGIEEIRERQQAVAELRPKLELREDLAVLGREVGESVDPGPLSDWGAAAPVLAARWPVWIALILALANAVTLVAWLAPQTAENAPVGGNLFEGSAPFAVSAILSMLFALWFRVRVHAVLHGAERSAHELELLAGVLARLEGERFESPLLSRLRKELETGGAPPSSRIRRLAWLVQVNESRHNFVFAPFAALSLTGTQLALAMERWRAVSGAGIERWLVALGAFEALSSIAGLAFEHPDDPFPELVAQGPCLDGEGLGHPLLPEARSVRNDVRLGLEPALLLVSGSNMSGKSTLLRTVGINAVLALAGAPVRAGSLRISPLAIGACMRIQDSLQAGLSHFYAEIQRLRKIVDLGDEGRATLFLLDEILHGTNSHDRRVGADALIRGLIDQGAIGLVTTHDLALAAIADELAPRARNVHFADRLEGDRIVFDYRLQDGVVRKSNALDLMRKVGLRV